MHTLIIKSKGTHPRGETGSVYMIWPHVSTGAKNWDWYLWSICRNQLLSFLACTRPKCLLPDTNPVPFFVLFNLYNILFYLFWDSSFAPSLPSMPYLGEESGALDLKESKDVFVFSSYDNIATSEVQEEFNWNCWISMKSFNSTNVNCLTKQKCLLEDNFSPEDNS